MVQLRSGADVAQEHVVDLWIEILLWDGVILLQTTATWSHEWSTHTRTVHTNHRGGLVGTDTVEELQI